jgi:hypothetical protein
MKGFFQNPNENTDSPNTPQENDPNPICPNDLLTSLFKGVDLSREILSTFSKLLEDHFI